MPEILVGLSGPAGVGKSAVARELVANHGFVRMAFADPLKLMLRALLASWGYNTASQDYWIDGGGKEVNCPALGYETPRRAMQLLGTEYGRLGLNHQVWVQHLTRRLYLDPTARRVVVDDVRFDNEAKAISALGGHTFDVTPARGQALARHPGEHVSEAGVSPSLITATLVNDFTFEGVAEQVRAVLLPAVWPRSIPA